MSQLVTFGPGQHLVGILSGDPVSTSPVLVLPNAGLIPRAGPFRLHVELAERLAAHGIRTFRFDTPGVGEAPRLPGCDTQEATLAALDHLAAHHGVDRFVVGGVCSAADLGWALATRDRRVVGMLMLDGISFTGFWFHFARIAGALRRGPGAWFGIARRLLGRTAANATAAAAGAGRMPFIAAERGWPGRAEARRQFTALVRRGARSLWIYTGGYADLFLHPRQFVAMFGRVARSPVVEMHYWPDCDHTFYARQHRDRLLGTIEQWMLTQERAGWSAR
ncbi:alpha/beta hydrolase family protein [Luteimonas sp. 22616]|uniref:alpha/beta hydrolase n=1 Tax=Luteimonas sp. 22616 TaxID=3453951 RepID=UPI003F851353